MNEVRDALVDLRCAAVHAANAVVIDHEAVRVEPVCREVAHVDNQVRIVTSEAAVAGTHDVHWHDLTLRFRGNTGLANVLRKEAIANLVNQERRDDV